MVDDPYLLDQRYQDRAGRFRFVILASNLTALARFEGAGSVPGTREFARMLDESVRVLPPGGKVRAIADLSALSKSPLRAQIILGKWLIGHRALVGKIAIVGAASWERKLATAVFTIARLTDIGFFEGLAEAQRYLDVQITMPEI